MLHRLMSDAAPRFVVINHTAANIHSVAKALERCGADTVVSSSPADLAAADGAVLPGVGASDAAMRALDRLGLIDPIKEFAASGRPLLGVCLGMQLLFEKSDEGDLPGLGLIQGEVVRLPRNGGRLKIPHMGWNSVAFTGDSEVRHPVFSGLPQDGYFYFVHSYVCRPTDARDIAATTHYGSEICAAVARGEIVATQFHPEKSQALGLRIYRNFVRHVAQRAARVAS